MLIGLVFLLLDFASIYTKSTLNAPIFFGYIMRRYVPYQRIMHQFCLIHNALARSTKKIKMYQLLHWCKMRCIIMNYPLSEFVIRRGCDYVLDKSLKSFPFFLKLPFKVRGRI